MTLKILDLTQNPLISRGRKSIMMVKRGARGTVGIVSGVQSRIKVRTKEGQLLPPTQTEDGDYDPLATAVPPSTLFATTDDPREGNPDNIHVGAISMIPLSFGMDHSLRPL